ncbi:MAG: ATP-binding protein [Sphingobacteriales bacterium]|nr:MAG: ATP-binding protein [Sphingobacteriales bacterium]
MIADSVKSTFFTRAAIDTFDAAWVRSVSQSPAVRFPDVHFVAACSQGVGIDETELPHLFSKYSKISSKPTDGEHSTGLGLSIVKRIVEELNGEISCESEPDRGSVFTVVLKK